MSDEEPEATGIGEGGGETGPRVLVCELLKGGPRGRGAAQAHGTPRQRSADSQDTWQQRAGLGLGWARQEKQKRPPIRPMRSLLCASRSSATPWRSCRVRQALGPEPDASRRHLFVWTQGMTGVCIIACIAQMSKQRPRGSWASVGPGRPAGVGVAQLLSPMQ